jgi:hypothetical protein
MGSQTDYFERIGYRPRYWIGDRVIGRWNGIPFVGTVGNDTRINDIEGPRISVHLDLPIRYEDLTRGVIIVKHRDIRPLKELELEDASHPTRKIKKSQPVATGQKRNPKTTESGQGTRISGKVPTRTKPSK